MPMLTHVVSIALAASVGGRPGHGLPPARRAPDLGAMAAVPAGIELVGIGSVPYTASDRSGLHDVISTPAGPMPHDRLGSFGSGIAYTGRGDVYIACDDRGPGDGASVFACRVQRLRVTVDPGSTRERAVKVACEETTLLRVPQRGVPGTTREAASVSDRTDRLSGSASLIDAADPGASLRFDPEAVRVGPDGTLYIADEYGPWLDRFSSDGVRLSRLAPPAALLNPVQARDPEQELPPHAVKGRQPNRGMEGLAMTPEGMRLYGIMQSPLIQDGALDSHNSRIGRNLRIIEFSLRPGAQGPRRQFVYQLDHPSHGVNELCAVSDRTFLVLERDGKGGDKAKVRRLYRIVLDGATDVSSIAALPAGRLPGGIQPVRKELFLDLMDPRFGLAGKEMPEKIEGMTFGPDLPDGRRLLLVTTDNDFLEGVATWIWAFSVDPMLLPDFQAQVFDAEPGRR